VLVLLAVGLLVFPLWHMNVPWREPEATQVASATPTATPQPSATQPAPRAVAIAPAPLATPAPTEVPAPAQPGPAQPQSSWTAAIDPPVPAVKWPTELHHLIDV